MADIQSLLKKIQTAIRGEEVRSSIHDAIKQCYYDGKAGGNDLEARDRAAAAEARIAMLEASGESGDTADEVRAIRTALDGTVYSSASQRLEEEFYKTRTIEVSSVEPTRRNTAMWINPDNRETFELPEIKDDDINSVDTWSSEKINHDILSSSLKWRNLKWACIGDSLTEINKRTTMHYHDYISELTGITVENMGVSGSGFMRNYESNKAYYQLIENVPADTSVVTIMGSGNDIYLTLGSPTDTGTDTLCGCINTTIDNLYNILPTVQLGLITPTPWESCPPNTENKMKEYSDTIVEICKLRGIPCLDLYRCSNLRPWDETFKTLAYSKDDGNGVHPDETGHKIIASAIKNFLDSLIGCY